MGKRTRIQVYLDAKQKADVKARSERERTTMSEQIRRAVDAYLIGIAAGELNLLDEAIKAAARELLAMAATLDEANDRLEAVLAELERRRAAREAG